METGYDMLKRFDFDLQLKVTEQFECHKLEILTSLLPMIERYKQHQRVA